MFDVGLDAGFRTIRVLDEMGLDHVGLDPNCRHEPKIVEVGGMRIGILAYTYGQNGRDEDFFMGPAGKLYMKPVLKLKSKYFKKNVEMVRRDFDKMKAENPDLIIVLPHMGGQFRSEPDNTQKKWCEIFLELGADIIFADHAHHVQPIEWKRNKEGKRCLIVHCPGNFINSYTEHDGDASMIVTAYLNKNDLEPFAVGVTPIYAHCPQKGQWIGLPTYKAIVHEEIYNSLSRSDFRRIQKVNRLVTGIAFGKQMDAELLQKEYISFADSGLVRNLNTPPLHKHLEINNLQSSLIDSIENVEHICFLGDSITDGMKNGDVGWFEPLRTSFPLKKFSSFALGGRTSRWLREHSQEIADIRAHLYVCAIGCNDIRYRNEGVCAMTAEDYVSNLKEVVDMVIKYNPKARFIFIAPWRSLSFDSIFKVSAHNERMKLYREYTKALANFCKHESYIFLDPNPLIFDNMESPDIRVKNGNEILKDFIHPDAYKGVLSYCQAVIDCG